MTQAELRPATAADLPAVLELLRGVDLPTAGVAESLSRFRVAEQDGWIVATAGLELHGSSAVLRSVAVAPTLRGTGIGRRLVHSVLEDANERGIQDVYLLTTTAERWFPRFGFAAISRKDVPARVQESIEFREACPASAVVMRKNLIGGR